MVIPLPCSGEIGLYFHIPFCKRKCDYCHFYVVPNDQERQKLLLNGLRKEWQLKRECMKQKRIVSVYFGGGTPSLLQPNYLKEILNWISSLSLDEDLEITLEANPEDVTADYAQIISNLGINRVSMGVQSFNADELILLSRQHSNSAAALAIDHLQNAGIDNISIDLMFDIPKQSLNSWEKTLAQAASLPIKHLSLYNLTIEAHTVFNKKRNFLEKMLPSEEESGIMYQKAIDILEAADLMQYEISAFAKDLQYSKHNSGYWMGRPFLGFGPSAFSYWDSRRFKNIANLHRYCHNLSTGQEFIDFEEKLSFDARQRELLTIQLRLKQGVNRQDFSLSAETTAAIDDLVQQGLLHIDDQQMTLTTRGRLFYDSVAAELV